MISRYVLSATPEINFWFGLFPFRSPLLRKSIFLSLPPGTEMFQFPGFTFIKLCIHFTIHGVSHVSFLIRKSSDLWLCASTRSLSQLIASFIGSWCQGIHHTPFVAWPFKFCYYKTGYINHSQRIYFLALLYFIYINLCAIFKEHLFLI